MATPQEIELLKRAKERGLSREQAKKALIIYRQKQAAKATAQPAEDNGTIPADGVERVNANKYIETKTVQPKGFLRRAGDAIVKGSQDFLEAGKKRLDYIKESAGDVKDGKILPGGFLTRRVPAAVLGLAGDAAGIAAVEGAKVIAPKKVEQASEAVGAGLNKFTATPTGKAVGGVAGEAVGDYSKWAEENPSLSRDAQALATIGTSLPTAKAAGVGLKAADDVLVGAGAVIEGGIKTVGRGVKGSANAVKSGAQAVKVGGAAAIETGADVVTGFKRGLGKVKETVAEKAAFSKLPEPVQKLRRVGLPDETVERVTTATPSTKPFLSKMVGKVSERMSNPARSEARALDVAGDYLTQKAYDLSKVTRQVGEQLGDVKRGLRGKVVDMQPIQEALVKDFDDLRLTVKNGRVVAQPGVPFDGDVLSVLNDVYKYAGSGNDAGIVDLLKTVLNKSFNKSGSPFSSNATRLLTKYKEGLVEVLNNTDTDYGSLAAQYARQMESLRGFTDLLGYKGSMEDITAQSLRAGEITRRILGQASARPTEIIDDLLDVARSVGLEDGVDFKDLVRFADELDDIVGPTQTTGLQGSTQRALEAAMDRKGGGSNILSLPVDITKGLIRLGAPGSKEKIEALSEFLRAKGLSGLKKKR